MTEKKKQLVLVVEGTASLCPHWQTILSDYLLKLIRKFCGNEAMEATNSVVELALVQFNAQESYNCACIINTTVVNICIYHPNLVAASNPCPLPTVYWPPNKSETQSVSHLSDAETVAKSFPQGKRNPSATAPTIDVDKNPNYLILISEDFMEACVALSPSVRTSSSNQSPSNMKVTSVSLVSEPPPTWQSVSRGNIPLATVKVEPSIVPPIAFSRAVNTYSPSTSKELISSNDNLPYLIVGSGSASLAGASQVAQHAGTTMTAPGMSQQVQGMQSVGVNNHIGTSLGLSQQTSSAPQSRQLEYVKIWEGKLDGIRHGQTFMITRLEAYRRFSSPESLAEDWPSTLVIDRLIYQENMNSRQYTGKCEFIVCRALNQHGFLGQMQERKLGAVIKLPSQTLLLAISDKPLRLIGMLLPRDMVV